MKSKNKQPLISIILPTYNSESTLARCLDSIISQTYSYKELIIMDGESQDNTIKIIKEKEINITYWESAKDKNIHEAWNKALKYANGDWIYFLGADDYLWKTNTLQQVANYLEDVPEDIKIVYGKVSKLLGNGELLSIEGKPWNKLRRRFLQVMCLEHQGLFHHKSFFEIYGQFDESYQISGDYELLLRYLKENNPVFIEEMVAVKLFIGMTANPENTLKTINEQWKARKQAGIKTVSFILIFRYFKAKLRSIVTPLIGINATQNLVNIYRILTGKKPIVRKGNI